VSFDAEFAAQVLPDLYEQAGVDAMVSRGGIASPVRIVVDRDQESMGDHHQVIGRVDRVRCQLSQWDFRGGDRVVWTDHLGAHDKEIERRLNNDGLESYGVLHG